MGLLGHRALSCVGAADCCLMGSGHELSSCGILGGPGLLLTADWQVESGS